MLVGSEQSDLGAAPPPGPLTGAGDAVTGGRPPLGGPFQGQLRVTSPIESSLAFPLRAKGLGTWARTPIIRADLEGKLAAV